MCYTQEWEARGSLLCLLFLLRSYLSVCLSVCWLAGRSLATISPPLGTNPIPFKLAGGSCGRYPAHHPPMSPSHSVSHTTRLFFPTEGTRVCLVGIPLPFFWITTASPKYRVVPLSLLPGPQGPMYYTYHPWSPHANTWRSTPSPIFRWSHVPVSEQGNYIDHHTTFILY